MFLPRAWGLRDLSCMARNGPGRGGAGMNSTAITLPDIARQIRDHHAQAMRYAETALEHAQMAGRLLMAAKAELAHGAWLPWLAEHCRVSPRQAQRYMRAAQGKPLPVRRMKSDTVSHLPSSQWVPPSGACMGARDEIGATWVVEPVDRNDGDYVFVSRIDERTGWVHSIRRGIARSHAAMAVTMIGNEYEPRAVDPATLPWCVHGLGAVRYSLQSLGVAP